MDSFDIESVIWVVVVAGTPIILAVGLFYGIRMSRKRSQNLIVSREQEQKKRKADRRAG